MKFVPGLLLMFLCLPHIASAADSKELSLGSAWFDGGGIIDYNVVLDLDAKPEKVKMTLNLDLPGTEGWLTLVEYKQIRKQFRRQKVTTTIENLPKDWTWSPYQDGKIYNEGLFAEQRKTIKISRKKDAEKRGQVTIIFEVPSLPTHKLAGLPSEYCESNLKVFAKDKELSGFELQPPQFARGFQLDVKSQRPYQLCSARGIEGTKKTYTSEKELQIPVRIVFMSK